MTSPLLNIMRILALLFFLEGKNFVAAITLKDTTTSVMVPLDPSGLDPVTRGDLSWATNCGGLGTVTAPAQLDGCDAQNCLLRMDRVLFWKTMIFSPDTTYTFLNLVLSISTTSPPQSDSTSVRIYRAGGGNFSPAERYISAGNVTIDSRLINNEQSPVWTIEVAVTNQFGEKVACRSFGVKLTNASTHPIANLSIVFMAGLLFLTKLW